MDVSRLDASILVDNERALPLQTFPWALLLLWTWRGRKSDANGRQNTGCLSQSECDTPLFSDADDGVSPQLFALISNDVSTATEIACQHLPLSTCTHCNHTNDVHSTRRNTESSYMGDPLSSSNKTRLSASDRLFCFEQYTILPACMQ